MNYPKNCFYQHGEKYIIDAAVDNNGNYTGTYSGETLEQIRKRCPGAELMSFDDAVDQCQVAQDKAYITGPVEITESEYDEALNVLPPMKWVNSGSSQSFRVCEALCGTIYAAYVFTKGRYFVMNEHASTSHESLVDQCLELISD